MHPGQAAYGGFGPTSGPPYLETQPPLGILRLENEHELSEHAYNENNEDANNGRLTDILDDDIRNSPGSHSGMQ